MRKLFKFIRSLTYCKVFGHTIIKTEKSGRVWCVSYVNSKCKRCGMDFGTETKLHDD